MSIFAIGTLVTLITILALCFWLVISGIRQYTTKKTPPLAPTQEQLAGTRRPIFRGVAHYIWPVWITLWLWLSTYLIATTLLHAEELVDILLFVIGFLGLFTFVIIGALYVLCKGVALWRHEGPLFHSYALKIYCVGLLGSLVIYGLFRETNPLRRYGVEFSWYDPPGSSGSWYEVQIHRQINGAIIEDIECGGGVPRISFSDEDGDKRKDIVIHADGEELAVFGVVAPYIAGRFAFTLIREADKGDFGCQYHRLEKTDEQLAQVRPFFHAMTDQRVEAQQLFGIQLSHIIGVPEANIQAIMPKIWEEPGDIRTRILPQLEKILDRPLTAEELRQIHAADVAKCEALTLSREQYASAVSPIVGYDVDEILKTFRE